MEDQPKNYDDMTEAEKARYDEQIAIKILGGFGVRNHMGDTRYALMVSKVIQQLVEVNIEDIECLIVVGKVRKVVDVQDKEKDLYSVIGGVVGTELELTALHAIAAARIRGFRAAIAEQLKQHNGERNG